MLGLKVRGRGIERERVQGGAIMAEATGQMVMSREGIRAAG